MKSFLLATLLLGWVMCSAQSNHYNEKYSEHITKQFNVSSPSKTIVCIYNLSGSVKVEGYNGDKVTFEVDESISALNNQELAKAKREIKLAFEQKEDSVIAYISEPYDTRPHNNWNRNQNHEKLYYDFKTNYIIKVPYNVNLHASTVTDGDVVVTDVYGRLDVGNVNGSVDIVNAKGTTTANTINGNLTVNYLSVPNEECSYYDLNGKLSVTYPSSLSANLRFKSMNGKFFTDFPDAEPIPENVVRSEEKNGSSTIYKLEQNTEVKIGNGGKLFRFETLNGNIYIKKQS